MAHRHPVEKYEQPAVNGGAIQSGAPRHFNLLLNVQALQLAGTSVYQERMSFRHGFCWLVGELEMPFSRVVAAPGRWYVTHLAVLDPEKKTVWTAYFPY